MATQMQVSLRFSFTPKSVEVLAQWPLRSPLVNLDSLGSPQHTKKMARNYMNGTNCNEIIIAKTLWIQVAAWNALRVQFGGNLYLLRRYLDP